MCNDLNNTVQNVGRGCMEGKDLGEDPGYQGLAEQSLVTRIVPKPVGAWLPGPLSFGSQSWSAGSRS